VSDEDEEFAEELERARANDEGRTGVVVPFRPRTPAPGGGELCRCGAEPVRVYVDEFGRGRPVCGVCYEKLDLEDSDARRKQVDRYRAAMLAAKARGSLTADDRALFGIVIADALEEKFRRQRERKRAPRKNGPTLFDEENG
jgi:hypothetical protein